MINRFLINRVLINRVIAMEQDEIFKTALSNFATDVACGGAIRHLTDIGYTLNQIVDRLDYPAPRAKVQKIMMEHLYGSRVLLREEPSEDLLTAPETYVQEQDAYGRRSMRKIIDDSDSQSKLTSVPNSTSMSYLSEERKIRQSQGLLWKEIRYMPKPGEKLTTVLHRKCEENGEGFCYVSCRFGDLRCLNNRQRDYLEGLCPDAPAMYHRLDQRMREIVSKLYEAGEYHGTAYFVRSKERLVL